MAGTVQRTQQRIRTMCLAFPEVTERLSHGAPTFFVLGKRAFVYVWADGHHDNDFPHLWCAAAPCVQEALVGDRPASFFRPPYVGHRGWIGVRLGGALSWDEVEDLCEDAYRQIAPRRLVAQLGEDGPPW